MPRRELTRAQALAWNPRWSYTDRETIEASFDRLGVVGFYSPAKGGYIGCTDASGRRVMTLYRGYAEFRKGLAPEGRPNPNWDGIDFSTIAHRGGPAAHKPRVSQEYCPTHHVRLPLTGVCDSCEA